MKFVKLTLSSNGLPTYINTKTINQIYEDTDKDGKNCTRIEFSNDYTKVSEPMKEVISKITKEDKETEAEKDHPESYLKIAKIAVDLGKVLHEYSPFKAEEVIGYVCIFMDTLTGDDLEPNFDLLATRTNLAEKIFKEWPHSAEYYKRQRKEDNEE